MPLRLSGLVSGMDTEGIVQELMKAQSLKKTRISNKVTTLEWKGDKWKDLNSKIYSFYTQSLSKMRFEGSYGTKKASSTNTDKVEVSAGTSAPEGSHKVSVHQLASSQYVTGKTLDNKNITITAGTKLVDLGFKASEGTSIKIAAGTNEVTLDIGSSTTINDFTNACKKAGLYATYDTTQKRFFISSKESGNVNSFSITTTSSETTQDRNAIRDYINYGAMSETQKSTVDNALKAYAASTSTADDKVKARTSMITAMHTQVQTKYIADYKAKQENIDQAKQDVLDGLEEGVTLTEAEMKAAVDKKLAENAQKAATEEYNAWKGGTAATGNVFLDSVTKLDELLLDYVTPSTDPVTQTNSLTILGLDEIIRTKDPEDGTYSVSVASSDVKLIQAQDAIMTYNGALITSTSNSITANGLTFTLKGLTGDNATPDDYTDDETISLGVTNDTQAVYDMIKGFVKTYNEIMKEMNDTYYAESARGYNPLTDEEKEAMTEDQIEKWEDKIKKSLLRRDSTISSIMSSMRTNLSKSVDVNGKSYSLSSFGVSTTGYTEKGLLHIYGDKDEAIVGMNENKLMKALTEDPDTVMKVFTKLASDVYEGLSDQMGGTSLRSALTFYNDKEIKNTLTDYKDELKRMEVKLADMESRYYKQFAAMESAMSKMNSQSSQLASMLGMNQN